MSEELEISGVISTGWTKDDPLTPLIETGDELVVRDVAGNVVARYPEPETETDGHRVRVVPAAAVAPIRVSVDGPLPVRDVTIVLHSHGPEVECPGTCPIYDRRDEPARSALAERIARWAERLRRW